MSQKIVSPTALEAPVGESSYRKSNASFSVPCSVWSWKILSFRCFLTVTIAKTFVGFMKFFFPFNLLHICLYTLEGGCCRKVPGYKTCGFLGTRRYWASVNAPLVYKWKGMWYEDTIVSFGFNFNTYTSNNSHVYYLNYGINMYTCWHQGYNCVTWEGWFHNFQTIHPFLGQSTSTHTMMIGLSLLYYLFGYKCRGIFLTQQNNK